MNLPARTSMMTSKTYYPNSLTKLMRRHAKKKSKESKRKKVRDTYDVDTVWINL